MAKYIDAERLKVEIDKLYREYKDKFHQCGDQYHLGLIDGLDMAERVLDSLESEKPMNMEEELNEEIKKEIANFPFFIRGKDQIAFARHFAQWGTEHLADARKTSPNDLEEAAIQYATHKKKSEEEEMETELPMGAYYLAKDSFIAGYNLCKEQMLKDAVEGRVFMSFAPGHNQMVMADVDLPTNTNVRVIVLPKENEE